MNNLNNNNVKKTISSKSIANNNWKNETRSLSALCKYVKAKGKADTMTLIAQANKRYKLKGAKALKLSDLATPKQLLAYMTDKQKFDKQGKEKTLFTYWGAVVLVIGRIAKGKAGIVDKPKAAAKPKAQKRKGKAVITSNMPSMVELRKQAKAKGVNSFGKSKVELLKLVMA